MLSWSKIPDLICHSKCMLSRSQIVCWIHELNIGCYLEVEQCNVFSTSIFQMDASPIILALQELYLSWSWVANVCNPEVQLAATQEFSLSTRADAASLLGLGIHQHFHHGLSWFFTINWNRIYCIYITECIKLITFACIIITYGKVNVKQFKFNIL